MSPDPYTEGDDLFETGQTEEPDEIEIDDDEEDSDDEPTREEKRKKRGQIFRALEEERSAHAKTREEVAELRGQFAQLQNQTTQQLFQRDQKDDIQEKIDSLFEEEEKLSKQATELYRSNSMSDETRQDMDRKYREIQQKRIELGAAKTIRDAGVGRQDPQAETKQRLMRQYGDVYNNQRAHQFAMGKWWQYIGEGYQPSEQLLEHVMGETRSKMGMDNPAANLPNSAHRRGMYSGVAGGQSGSNGRRTVRMDSNLRSLAEARYPDLEPAKAHKRWAKEIGPQYLKDQEG